MNLADGKLGILGLAAFIIAVVGVWTFAIEKFAARHPDSAFIQATQHYW